jgi:type IV fimbrial biogenesis protein FimT
MQIRGFTIVELMVTLALVAITTSLAAPPLYNLTLDNRRADNVNELVSQLQYARSEAITRTADVVVCPSTTGKDCEKTTWQSGWLIFADPNGNAALDAGEPVLKVGDAIAGATFETAEFASFLRFRSNGRVMVKNAAESSGEFTVCDDRGAEYARVVQIDLAGRPVVAPHLLDGSDPVCPL